MISEYMEQAAALFWDYPAVNILHCTEEWLCFLLYCHSLPARNLSRIKRSMLHIAFFAVSLILHLKNYTIVIYFPLYMLLCVGFVWLTCNITLPRAIFKICPFGFSMEFCRLLCQDAFLTFLLVKFSSTLSGVVSIYLCAVLYSVLLIPSTLLVQRETADFEELKITPGQLVGFVFPLALYIAVRQSVFTSLLLLNWSQWLRLELLQLAILACSNFETIAAGRMAAAEIEHSELLEKQVLLEKRQQQYSVQAASVDAINHRYHDLKHYLTAMENMNAKEAGASVQAIRQEIEVYECMQKTGNKMLDILLFERMRECQEKNIRLIPYIDTRKIEFINLTDLCVIFGNAMDNAIEASEKLKYVNMKEISIKIGVSNNLLIMRFHNYYDGTLRYEAGKLQTQKSDSLHHGYGIESIREAVAKYGGTVAHDVNGNEFSLNILIPIIKSEK
ncbi:MAG: GHKL domain-containing protein [Lachnospiraceae bacterium]|nr:GHKL domain-containing protein [Lachnospiraceae bacterium]